MKQDNNLIKNTEILDEFKNDSSFENIPARGKRIYCSPIDETANIDNTILHEIILKEVRN